MRYYIADTHFFHKEGIEFLNRPFKDLDQMHDYMIKKWNNKVRKHDEVYILGDFAATKHGKDVNDLLKKLNGKKTLIIGNHDRFLDSPKFNHNLLKQSTPYLKIKDMAFGKEFRVILCHYPIAVWECENYGTIHVHGHVHGNPNNRHGFLNELHNRYDVFADAWAFEPVTLAEILYLKGYVPKSIEEAKRKITVK